jgi:hypothetical protein
LRCRPEKPDSREACGTVEQANQRNRRACNADDGGSGSFAGVAGGPLAAGASVKRAKAPRAAPGAEVSAGAWWGGGPGGGPPALAVAGPGGGGGADVPAVWVAATVGRRGGFKYSAPRQVFEETELFDNFAFEFCTAVMVAPSTG